MPEDRNQREEDVTVFLFVGVLGVAALYTFGWVINRFWYHFVDLIL